MRYQADECRDGKRVIAALEYAIANFAATAELRASSVSADFVPPPAWYDMETDVAHSAMASRVLLRSETPPPTFVSNTVIQYFTLGDIDPIRLSTIDTTLDIQALPGATVVDHTVGRNGYLCADYGGYVADGLNLHVRRSQLAYLTSTGQSALAIFTATAPVPVWETIESEIREMEDLWLTKISTPTSGDS
ncbi:acetyltransferase [Gordonia amicalis]|uniref:acetyltransferase n=1 Tax=Gordonia amicalis TaxID=89053 RepID=UPI00387DD0B7